VLVLTRQVGQMIVVEDRIEVCVLSVVAGKVRVGVDVPIFRKEIHNGQPSLATPMERYAEMRAGGSRRFVERTWTP
jgi:Global regulator protein family